MAAIMQKSQATYEESREALSEDTRMLAAAPMRRLTRDVVGVVTIKVAFLALIYILFFYGASHRLTADAGAHIAGTPSSTAAR
jgi:hypothetical protein